MLRRLAFRSRDPYLQPSILYRTFSTAPTRFTRPPASPFAPSPSPPRLPKEDQETFDSLTKASLGAFSSPATESENAETELLELEKHADARRGGEKPLFEGDKNPATGEVGGPKTEPTKYGDWSFNGRVTDF
ncbi:putative mitochondrial protein, conserved [Orbilia brochopaga]|uniref:Succinate dehydrogenase assembly factor 4, mitochondrial n=1 Tax=Orbilia brochopaga TaxID=3140254 RepID=A0AAV9VBS4_9PEZI